MCKDDIKYTKNREGSIGIYTALKGKYKILKFSGDTDGAVPTFGTQQWINKLDWKVKDAWKVFMIDGQVGGYVETREDGKFVYATIHGAGHMAPQWRRPQTYHVIFNFIQGKPI